MKSNNICVYCKYNDGHDYECEYCYNFLNFEGLDVELAVHGHWEIDEDGNMSCSECGNAGFGRYCPNCGARMDGDD